MVQSGVRSSKIGLSVLIPVYNFDCRPFVEDIWQQLKIGDTSFEIICLDDKSETSFQKINTTINSLDKRVQYHLSSINLGRSKIRNHLGQLAQYEYLLFLDCDQKVVRSDYIQQYLTHLQSDKVLYGGTTYSATPPNEDQLLRWCFGRKREMIPALRRNESPHHYFMTNNFLIPKVIFQSIQFNEDIRQYGHEDTLFALALKKKKISIIHLDNPVEHLGLDNNDAFLQKSAIAIETLIQLVKAGQPIETKLLKAYRLLKRYRLVSLYRFLFIWLEPLIKKTLVEHPQRLYFFDAWKLGKMCQN